MLQAKMMLTYHPEYLDPFDRPREDSDDYRQWAFNMFPDDITTRLPGVQAIVDDREQHFLFVRLQYNGKQSEFATQAHESLKALKLVNLQEGGWKVETLLDR